MEILRAIISVWPPGRARPPLRAVDILGRARTPLRAGDIRGRAGPTSLSKNRPAFLLVFALLWLPPTSAFSSPPPKPEPKPEPARFKISGLGWLRNYETKRSIRSIEGDRLKQPFFDADLLEDIGLVLLARVRNEGFLHPTINLDLRLLGGERRKFTWHDGIEPPLPRPLSVREARFHLHKGVRFHYRNLTFTGLQTLKPDKARAFFLETGVLPLAASRPYSPGNLNRGLASLTETLDRQGYHQATATVGHLTANPKSGAVDVQINVLQGPKFIVNSLRVERYLATNAPPVETRTIQTNKPYSRLWLEDFSLSLKTNNYHQGYPDTTVTFQTLRSNGTPALVFLDLAAIVQAGPRIHVGQVEFHGARRTRSSVLRRRVSIHPGDLLDPTVIAKGQSRLARLGIFDSIQVTNPPVNDRTRNVIYELKESKALTMSVLAGWGSYELLRGGVEIKENNIFGLGHSARLRAIQSFKSSRGEFTYNMPELLGEDIDVFSRGFALRREEVTFTREEYGGGAGLHRYFSGIATDVSGRYEYQVLNARPLGPDFATLGPTNPGVGAVIFDLRHDRRDNPLYPTRGYKVFSTIELASEYFAGDVTYERFDFSGSYHHPIVAGLHLNLGVSHGFVTTPGAVADDVPFNKRFFPGGADSIRGYQDNEASPRNPLGKFIGAESYVLGSVEFEQAITHSVSVVAFSDNLGYARGFEHYPFDRSLHSVGGGLRFRTIVGPIRFEYGHNLNRRPGDPAGTFHFSLGFPF